jgi:hypothetical protein
MRPTDYGTCYEIRVTPQAPTDLPLTVHTIWQIKDGTDIPQLITPYPD